MRHCIVRELFREGLVLRERLAWLLLGLGGIST
jgi:hypothetical protein